MENQIIIQVGTKCTGKTEFCKFYLKETKPKRGLILDVFNEYNDYPVIEKDSSFIEDKKQKGIFRINLNHGKYSVKQRCKIYKDAILKFNNGTIICENPFVLMNKIPNDIIHRLSTNRFNNIKLIINFNTLKQSLDYKRLIDNTEILIMRRTIDNIEKYKNIFKTKLIDHYDILKSANYLIEKNICDHALINLDLQKIAIKDCPLNNSLKYLIFT